MNQRGPVYLRPQRELRRQRARRRLAAIAAVVFLSVFFVFAIMAVRTAFRGDGSETAQPATSADDEALPSGQADTAAAHVEPLRANTASIAPPAPSAPFEDEGDDTAEEFPESSVTEEAEFWGPPDPFTRLTGTVQAGDTFGAALDSAGVPGAVATRLIQALRGTLDFRRIRPQDRFDLLITARGELLEFVYERGMDEIYRINDVDGKWLAFKEARVFKKRLTLIEGTVETTLSEAVAAIGERADLIMNFVEIFAWEIDFSVFTRKGDRFLILCEKLYDDKDNFRGYGRIHKAVFVNAGQRHTATYYEAPDGFSGYFDEEGLSLRKAFLKAPLKFNAITSGFTHSRFHPVLKYNRPHLGVDYAARTGTPIWSVADGTVTRAGWMGGSGRAVIIKHRNGYETSYSHMSRIAPGMQPGARVKQKQVIGYVGASGLATGPHLHFGMKHNGVALNPAGVKLPAGDPVPRKYMADYQAERRRWLTAVDEQRVAQTQLASDRATVFPTSGRR
jgi:murein DD-endopeptidase MepM/ murein hydrolase activator NlpD